jgi:site-specific recombinase XerC
MMAGVRSYYAGRITAAKAALSLDHIRKGLCRKPVKALEYRDRALILVGHSCGLRRSLLVGIDYEHLIFESNGHVRIVLPQGRIISLSPRRVDCPVKALRAWLELSGIKGGAVFVSVDRHGNLGGRIRGETVARIVKKIARAAGLNPGQFSADSLAKRDCGV